uniref:Sorting nexin-14 n=1 Tax=Ascaris lumbricoides TaxID=6252 RepID=A0A0M3IPP1_ASCLU
MVEMKILERMEDVHYALCSRQNEVNYLRQVADHIVARFVDENRVAGRASDDDSPLRTSNVSSSRAWPSHACRHFLRELIVFTFLIPVLDLIADPDTINRLLILLFDPESMNISAQSEPKMVEFLHRLTDCALSDAPDSLLQLKLSEILRDSRQLNMFTMYLKDVRGPTNELYFLLHSADVHERMLNLQKDENMLSELHYDIWEIFSKYVHNAAPERVTVPEEVHDEFQDAVETRNIEALDHAIEKAFQLVYKRLQHDYVVPFCQSDCYLGHLCGSPPVSVDELMIVGERSNIGRRLTLPGTESSFSLSQFRNRLWKVLMPSSVDGSAESSFDRLSDLSSMHSYSPVMQVELANDASAVAGSNPSPEFMTNFTSLPSIDVTYEGDVSESTDGICEVQVTYEGDVSESTDGICEVQVSPGSISNSEGQCMFT